MRWTEKQIEEYLEDETRVLTSHDGRKISLTLMKTYWITLEAVGVDDVYTESDLVAWAEERVEKEGLTLTQAMQGNLALLDHEFRRQHGM